MSKRTQLSEIDSAREALERASRERAHLASEASAMRSAALRGKRIGASGRTGLDATSRFREAMKREDDLLERLTRARVSSLSASHSEDVKELSTEFPIVLLPVRIETRFMKKSMELLVRIYPDEIVAETFEPELTENELNAGVNYWRLAWNLDKEKDSWKVITGQYSSERSAWIVLATTPTNLSQRPLSEPTFPAVDMKAQSWTRPARTRTLPDRWVVIAYRSGNEVLRLETSPVQEPLALTIDPWIEPDETSPDGPGLDKGVVWTVDFEEAVKAGMALRMPLDDEDVQKGFDRLIAVGVKTTLLPDQGGARLADLLDGHHYSRGLAFVGQGTPTNNTKSFPSGFPPSDIGGSYSFGIERGEPLVSEGSDGSIFMRALGVPPNLADHVAGAGGSEQRAARAMSNALWPGTLGYYLESILGLKAGDLADARKHFVNYVCGRGPYPAFRVGATPYGLLPVSSLSRPVIVQGSPEAGIISKALGARRIWIDASAKAPMIGKTSDPDKDLLEVLAMDASAQEIRIRTASGGTFINLLKSELGYDIDPWMSQKQALSDALSGKLSAFGLPSIKDLPGPVLDMTFGGSSYIFKNPIVSETLSEAKGLDPNYMQEIIDEMSGHTLDEIRLAEPSHKELLYLMLRHSILQENDSLAWKILIDHGILTGAFRPEPEITGLGGTLENAWDRLSEKVPDVTGDETLWDFLKDSDAIASYKNSLSILVPLPTAELQRLFTETLDVCSHRLDAWATSLATSRLDEMRQKNPMGSYVGGFGWIEDLRPEPDGKRKTVTLLDGRTVYVQENSGGYIQTPSMVHASAAAVLRSGFLTHALDGGSSFDINLSSQRVRNARWVLDTVRQGQFLGAVLGYSVERGLHERGVETLIEPLRKTFPLPEGSTNDIAGASAIIAARNVVDGLALRTAWRKGDMHFGENGMPHCPPLGEKEVGQMDALTKEVAVLDDLVDSVADLLTAESVYQIVKGNTSGASASLDTMARGARPHDPEILRQPRTGTTLTHRALMVLGGDIILVDAWKKSPLTPRAKAEPFLNRWAGQMLGDPAFVRCRAECIVTGRDGTPERKEMVVTLEDLRIRPVDFLTLVAKADAGGEMNQRIADVVLKAHTDAREIKMIFRAGDGWDRGSVRTFPEIIEVGRAVNSVISVSRPLAPEDVLHPASALAQSAGADRMGKETLDRADDARNALRSEKLRLEREIEQMEASGGSERADLIDALKKASLFGLEGAFPVTPGFSIPGDKDLLSAARRVLTELIGRIEKAKAIRDEITSSTSDTDIVKMASQITKEVFGKEFVFLPRFRPADASELRAALNAGLKGLIDSDQGVRDNTIRKWIQSASRVRKPLELWRKLWLYAEALGVPAARLDAAQLPHIDGARWAALPFDGEGERPISGNLSMVLYRPSILGLLISPAAANPWVGLVLDEWTEIIPNVRENTGIAFHYDNPGAEAAQAVLIAVPSADSQTWDLDNVIEAVSDTMDMSMMRLCDLEMIDDLAQVLPSILLASNTGKDAISMDISKEIKGDPKSNGGA